MSGWILDFTRELSLLGDAVDRSVIMSCSEYTKSNFEIHV